MSEKKLQNRTTFSKITLSRPFGYDHSCRFWAHAKCLVLNWLLDSCYIFVEENTKLKINASWFKTSRMGNNAFLLQCIPGHKAFLLKPSLDPGLSYQVPVTGIAKDRAGVQGCAVVNYHWGKPRYTQVVC